MGKRMLGAGGQGVGIRPEHRRVSRCEPAQAGCRNNHKTTDGMQIVNLFRYLTNLPEAAPGQRHTSGNAGAAELGPCWRITEPAGFAAYQGFTQA